MNTRLAPYCRIWAWLIYSIGKNERCGLPTKAQDSKRGVKAMLSNTVGTCFPLHPHWLPHWHLFSCLCGLLCLCFANNCVLQTHIAFKIKKSPGKICKCHKNNPPLQCSTYNTGGMFKPANISVRHFLCLYVS